MALLDPITVAQGHEYIKTYWIKLSQLSTEMSDVVLVTVGSSQTSFNNFLSRRSHWNNFVNSRFCFTSWNSCLEHQSTACTARLTKCCSFSCLTERPRVKCNTLGTSEGIFHSPVCWPRTPFEAAIDSDAVDLGLISIEFCEQSLVQDSLLTAVSVLSNAGRTANLDKHSKHFLCTPPSRSVDLMCCLVQLWL